METKSKCGPEIRRRKPASRNSETHEWAMESARNREGEILTTDCRMNADRGPSKCGMRNAEAQTRGETAETRELRKGR
jgi:hypothetical protein